MPRKSVDWPNVRKVFEQTDTSVASLSKTFKVSRAAIDKRAKKECWLINSPRIELMAAAIGGSSGTTSKTPTGGPVTEASAKPIVVGDSTISPTAWRRARELYEGTRMPLPAIARDVGIPEVDIDFRIADQGWSRFGRRMAPTGSSEYRDGAMHATADAVPAPSAPAFTGIVPPEVCVPRVDLRKVRSPKRAISARDKPPVEFHKARKLKASALADMGRDAAMSYMTQLRDLIGNQDIVNDMLNEWNEDHAHDDPFPKGKFEALELLTNIKELGLMLKSAGAAYRAFCEGDGAVGKKERQNQEAGELAETSPFAQQPPPPKLVAAGGKTV